MLCSLCNTKAIVIFGVDPHNGTHDNIWSGDTFLGVFFARNQSELSANSRTACKEIKENCVNLLSMVKQAIHQFHSSNSVGSMVGAFGLLFPTQA